MKSASLVEKESPAMKLLKWVEMAFYQEPGDLRWSPGAAINSLSGRGQPTSPLWASVFSSVKWDRWERWFLNCLSALVFVFVSKFKKGRVGGKERGGSRKIFEFYSAGLGKCHYFELLLNGPSNINREKKKSFLCYYSWGEKNKQGSLYLAYTFHLPMNVI